MLLNSVVTHAIELQKDSSLTKGIFFIVNLLPPLFFFSITYFIIIFMNINQIRQLCCCNMYRIMGHGIIMRFFSYTSNKFQMVCTGHWKIFFLVKEITKQFSFSNSGLFSHCLALNPPLPPQKNHILVCPSLNLCKIWEMPLLSRLIWSFSHLQAVTFKEESWRICAAGDFLAQIFPQFTHSLNSPTQRALRNWAQPQAECGHPVRPLEASFMIARPCAAQITGSHLPLMAYPGIIP